MWRTLQFNVGDFTVKGGKIILSFHLLKVTLPPLFYAGLVT